MITNDKEPQIASPAAVSSEISSHDVARDEIRAIFDRVEFEHDLLVKRTAAILTLNGLIAIAVNDRLPTALRLLATVVMIVMNFLWLFRAVAAQRFIDLLYSETRKPQYASVLPLHAKLHLRYTDKRWIPWLNSTNFFSVGIPIGLLMCWTGGLLIAWFAK